MHNPDPSAPGPSPRSVHVLLAALAVLGLAEVLCRRESLLQFSAVVFAERKAALLARAAPTAVLAGDSTVNAGLDAALFAAGLGGPALNLALNAGTPILLRAMLRGAPPPPLLVYGLMPVQLSDGWRCEPAEFAAATLGERLRLEDPGEALLSTLWRGYRLRPLLQTLYRARRQPGVPAGVILLGRSNPEDEAFSLGLRPYQRRAVSRADADLFLRRWLHPRPPTLGVRFAALAALTARLRQGGGAVVYVLMPLHSALRRALAESPAAAFPQGALRRLRAEAGGRALDCSAAADDEDFYDPYHLADGASRRRLSRSLGEALARGGTPAGCVDL